MQSSGSSFKSANILVHSRLETSPRRIFESDLAIVIGISYVVCRRGKKAFLRYEFHARGEQRSEKGEGEKRVSKTKFYTGAVKGFVNE